MNSQQSAVVVLSAAGRRAGDVDAAVAQAEAIVGPDMVEKVAASLLTPWVEAGGSVIAAGDQGWPTGLDRLGAAAPLMLWVRGSLPTAAESVVAVVGARDCSDYGGRIAGVLATRMTATTRTVVSGGALGIDVAAHRAALSAGGPTVVVAAGGAGRVYPQANRDVFARAVVAGAVVWEFPPGSRLIPAGFLHRNRLIAAMAGTTILVEAAERSGALNTGRAAADLGRLVLGVPGPIDSPRSTGVHRAVAEGWAALLVSPHDLDAMLPGAC
jgi:DNA processing protein